MLVFFSHILAFSTLFIAALWDLETTDVPDHLGVIGVLGGIILHAAAAYTTGSPDPLVWSLGVGVVFSLYGWGAYLLGMWGGADAFAMSVLGFAAPYGLSGVGVFHSVNLFVNLMLVGFLYTVGFAVYKAYQTGEVLSKTWRRLENEENRVAVEVLAAGMVSAMAELAGLNGPVYFAVLLSMILLYRFLKVLEEEAMSFEKQVSELEAGDVIDLEDVEIERARQKNRLGETLQRIRLRTESLGLTPFSSRMESLENRIAYPEIVGVTQKEIDKLEELDVERVDVKTGARFVPVFPLALFVTDVFGGGLGLLIGLF